MPRGAPRKYRTTPLRGLWQHPPYFHDGSAPDLLAVVNHYNQLFELNLTAATESRPGRIPEVALSRFRVPCRRNAPIGYDSSAPRRRIRCALTFVSQGSDPRALNASRE